MRTWPIAAILLFGATGLAGCSSVTATRPQTGQRVRTITSIGDQPVSIVAGEPGDRVRSEHEARGSTPAGEGRISGRVVDERGRPVANAEVRLADGSRRAGQDQRVLTDESGGFTIHRLRRGSTYTLIANAENDRELLVGRLVTEAPETQARIRLQADAGGTHIRRASSSAALPEDADELARGDVAAGPTRINHDDVGDVEESLPSSSDFARERRKRTTAQAAWKNASGEGAGALASDSRFTSDRTAEGEEDEVNPLPPAKERAPETAPAQDSPASNSQRDEPAPSDGDGPDATRSPKNVEAGEAATNPFPAQGSSPPAAEPDPEPPIEPSDRGGGTPPRLELNIAPVPTPSGSTPAVSTGSSTASRETAADRKRPSWRELMDQSKPVEIAPGMASAYGISRKPRRRAATESGATNVVARSNESPELLRPYCQFDAKDQRVVDFRLPDLDGKPVRLQDIDSDLILLDFWGTWCGYCLDSIPHLVDLQERYGAKRLTVVGVAYEHVSPAERQKLVAETSRKLGINYPVLLSSQDGAPCPLQAALHIQNYPTMVLLDRKGKILWRDTGSTTTTLARLDRVLAARLDASSDTVRR